ncbi:MAG: hypothetical protein KJI70_00150 [Patescibacteria group bacterium]|nr:hypothetical protein [Patescibacteria group bacterium]
MDISKIIGWLVFSAGMLIIVFTVYTTYNIFTGKDLPPQIIKLDIGQPKTSTETDFGTDQIGQIISEQLSGLLPLDSLPYILNLVAWTIGAGIFILGGFKISELGIKLINK